MSSACENYKELRRLVLSLYRQHYASDHDAVPIEPLDDIPGLISQIDNMTAGLSRNPTRKPWAWHVENVDDPKHKIHIFFDVAQAEYFSRHCSYRSLVVPVFKE